MTANGQFLRRPQLGPMTQPTEYFSLTGDEGHVVRLIVCTLAISATTEMIDGIAGSFKMAQSDTTLV